MTRLRSFLILVLFAALASVAAAGVLLAPTAAQAQTVSAEVGVPLKEAQQLAAAGDFQGAIRKAKEAQAMSGKTAYEEFIINDFLGYCYTQVRDYRNAAIALEAALNSGQAPANTVARRVKTLAQLYYQVKDYTKSISYADRYFRQYGNDQDLRLMVSQIYYQQGNYTRAVESVNTLIDNADTPKKAWLQLLYVSADKAGDATNKRKAIELLVQHYPSADYWRALVGIVQTEGALGDALNFELRRLKYTLELFNEAKDYRDMAQLSGRYNVWGEAKTVFAAGFTAKLLGVGEEGKDDARLMTYFTTEAARDLTLMAQRETEAAAAATGDGDIKVGEQYFGHGQTEKAIAALTRGLAKPGTTTADEGRLILGRIYYEQGDIDEAEALFEAVQDPKAKAVAELWLLACDQA